MAHSTITLTTDFGLSDHYVAAMKGVILGICPDAQIADVSHQIAPFQIAEAAYLIAQTYAHFPKKTVHVVVVDPGVGSARRPILMEAAGQYFVGPDNGVFTLIMAQERHKVRELTAQRYFRHPVSQTFHGRDIFAPVAAHLAAGTPPARVGRLIAGPVRLDLTQPQVLHVDRFGNIVTNLRPSDIAGKPFSLQIGRAKISAAVHTYAAPPLGKLFVIEGSSGYLEVSMNQASAEAKIGCRAGDAIQLSTGR